MTSNCDAYPKEEGLNDEEVIAPGAERGFRPYLLGGSVISRKSQERPIAERTGQVHAALFVVFSLSSAYSLVVQIHAPMIRKCSPSGMGFLPR